MRPCENLYLYQALSEIVLQQACKQLHRWHQQGWKELTMSVNLSVRQFTSPTLLADIDRVLTTTLVGLTQSKISPHPPTLLRQAQDIASPAGEGAQNSNFFLFPSPAGEGLGVRAESISA